MYVYTHVYIFVCGGVRKEANANIHNSVNTNHAQTHITEAIEITERMRETFAHTAIESVCTRTHTHTHAATEESERMRELPGRLFPLHNSLRYFHA